MIGSLHVLTAMQELRDRRQARRAQQLARSTANLAAQLKAMNGEKRA